jgi:hypothetical protein
MYERDTLKYVMRKHDSNSERGYTTLHGSSWEYGKQTHFGQFIMSTQLIYD